MKLLTMLEAKNVVGRGFKVAPDFEVPVIDAIFAVSLFTLGMAWGPFVMPIMAYNYGYTFLDFKREEPV
jgi:hypothetical protein